eukprot:TRINITY_DN110628_c0_g1_i1.p1 TRINITY_DN110628_c0_g1~~TRINITY_DN110628_c0_g1_i1.p1  ORF type:complete len:351 (+),score=57.28 TRINITY_DN110628_c0_g1_i1:175-1227(+)
MIARRPGGLGKRHSTIDLGERQAAERRSTIAAGSVIARSTSQAALVARSPSQPFLPRRTTIDVLSPSSPAAAFATGGSPSWDGVADDFLHLNEIGSSTPSTRSGESPELNGYNKASVSRSKSVGESLGAKAVRASKAYNMTFKEAKDILEVFEKISRTVVGRFCKRDLHDFLCNLFHAKEIPDSTLDEIYYRTCQSDSPQGFDMEAFLAWHMCSFSKVAKLRGDKAAVQKAVSVDEICAKHGFSPNDLDKVRRVFDRFDTDGSGVLDKDEFELMIVVYLGATKADISKERLATWWREIDMDGSGQVEFPEFVEWYAKYFGSADSMTPTQAFYASFNPSVQRMNVLMNSDG